MNTALIIQTDLDSRTLIYRQLAKLFCFPDPAFLHELGIGQWNSRLGHAVDQIVEDEFKDTSIDQRADIYMRDTSMNLTPEEYEVEFIALYEVGMGGAPCPLHSGHYARDRMKTMEEILRFNRFFDYQPDRSADRFPDHLSFELEFMAHLSELGHKARTGEEDDPSYVASFMLAQRDFLYRHLISWVSDLAARIENETRYDFFEKSGKLLCKFVQRDYEYLERECLEQESVNSKTDSYS